jgi:RimJ/RimL family protein N-acetyltransferase
MVLTSLQSYKFSTHAEAVVASLSVPGTHGVKLVPIGEWILPDSSLIQDFSTWRAHNRDMYFAQFPESIDSMQQYLSKYTVQNPALLLFLIEGGEGDPLGHVGLKLIDTESAEIDSVMKSPSNTTPGLMDGCLKTLINFAADSLELMGLQLEVISYNTRAIDLYSKNGFSEIYRSPLHRIQSEELIIHNRVKLEDANVDYFSLTMARRIGSNS